MNQSRLETIRISLALIQLLEPETLIKEKLDDKREQVLNLNILTGACVPSHLKIFCKIDFSGASLVGVDLSRADLSGANLSTANLRQTDLSGARLVKTQFSNPPSSFFDSIHENFIKYGLLKNDLQEDAIFNPHKLSGANLRGCDLSGANLYSPRQSKVVSLFISSI